MRNEIFTENNMRLLVTVFNKYVKGTTSHQSYLSDS